MPTQRYGITGRRQTSIRPYLGGYGYGPGTLPIGGPAPLNQAQPTLASVAKVPAEMPSGAPGVTPAVLGPNYEPSGPVSTAARTAEDPANKYAYSPAWNDFMREPVMSRMPFGKAIYGYGTVPERIGSAAITALGAPATIAGSLINAGVSGLAGYHMLSGADKDVQGEIAGSTRDPVSGGSLGPTGQPLSLSSKMALTDAREAASSPWSHFGKTLASWLGGNPTPKVISAEERAAIAAEEAATRSKWGMTGIQQDMADLYGPNMAFALPPGLRSGVYPGDPLTTGGYITNPGGWDERVGTGEVTAAPGLGLSAYEGQPKTFGGTVTPGLDNFTGPATMPNYSGITAADIDTVPSSGTTWSGYQPGAPMPTPAVLGTGSVTVTNLSSASPIADTPVMGPAIGPEMDATINAQNIRAIQNAYPNTPLSKLNLEQLGLNVPAAQALVKRYGPQSNYAGPGFGNVKGTYGPIGGGRGTGLGGSTTRGSNPKDPYGPGGILS